jgi:hypothetical protein
MIRKASMLKAIAVFVAVFGFSLAVLSPAQAQEKDEWNKPITKSGSAALIFSIDGLGTFNVRAPGMISVPIPRTGLSGSGLDSLMPLTGIGGKFFISDDLALRLGLGFNTMTSKAADTTASPSTTNYLATTTAWGLGVGAEMHFRPLYSVSPYGGLQIMFASSSATEPSDEVTTYSGHSFGVQAFFGFDWFVTRGIALGAEGGLGWQTWGLERKFTPKTGTSTDFNGPVGSSIAIAMNGLVHVVVYF